MARINPLFGRMKGKYGGSVMYSYNGKQCMRERVIEVSNPRSSRQAIQRAILATCGRFVSAFTPVLNNSIQSESSKVKTLAKIRSYNMNYLRQLAAQNLGFYNRKGSVYVSPNDYIISRGDLQGINPLRSEAARLFLDSGSLLVPFSELNTDSSSATASQAFPSIAVGDQITILATYTADFSRTTTIVRYCRFAFKDDATPVFLDGEDGFSLNPAAVDLTKADGDWRLLTFTDDDLEGVRVSKIIVSDLLGVDRADMCGIIISREAEKKRSSAYMVSAIFDDDPDFLLEGVYPTYMAGSSNIEMPSDVYLDNDANVAPPSPNDMIGITMNNSDPLVLPHQFGTSVSPSTIMVLVPRSDYVLPSNFTVRVNYTAGNVAKVASFSPNDTATIDDVTWQVSGANIQINRAEQTGGTNQVTVNSVTYIDRAAGINKTWE